MNRWKRKQRVRKPQSVNEEGFERINSILWDQCISCVWVYTLVGLILFLMELLYTSNNITFLWANNCIDFRIWIFVIMKRIAFITVFQRGGGEKMYGGYLHGHHDNEHSHRLQRLWHLPTDDHCRLRHSLRTSLHLPKLNNYLRDHRTLR